MLSHISSSVLHSGAYAETMNSPISFSLGSFTMTFTTITRETRLLSTIKSAAPHASVSLSAILTSSEPRYMYPHDPCL